MSHEDNFWQPKNDEDSYFFFFFFAGSSPSDQGGPRRKRVRPKVHLGQPATLARPRGLQQTQRLLSQLAETPVGGRGRPRRPQSSFYRSLSSGLPPAPSLQLLATPPRPASLPADHALVSTEQQSHSAKLQLAAKLELRGAI